MKRGSTVLGILVLAGMIGLWGFTQFAYGQQKPGAPQGQPGAAPKLPDLKVVHTDHQPAGEVSAGKIIQFKVTVKNFGTGAALGTVRPDGSTTADGYMIDLSLSKNPISDPVRPHVVPSPYIFTEGMLLKGGRISRTQDLAPGASKEYSASIEIPKDTPPGKYWIGVSLDPFNRVAEGPPTGESDNAVNHGIIISRAYEEKRSLPDLIIVRGTLRTTGTPTFSGETIVVPIELRIENKRGGSAAGAFQLSIMWQYPAPAAPMETELEFTGTRTFSGLGSGDSINVRGQVIFPKSQAGNRVKIRAIVDSMSQVQESNEMNNVSQWLEVQLPPEIGRPPLKAAPKRAQ